MTTHRLPVLGLLLLAIPGCGGGGGAALDAGPPDAMVPPSRLVLASVRVVALTSTSAVLGFYTYYPASSQAELGVAASYGTTTPEDPTPVQVHTVAVDGLTPATGYHFRVTARAGELTATSADQTFTTLPDHCATGTASYLDAAAPAGGDGSSWATAWRSPADVAWGGLGAGDCLLVQAGSYGDALAVHGSGAAGDPLLVFPVGPAVLTGGLRIDGSDVVVRGFEVTNLDPASRGEGVELTGDRVQVLDLYLHDTAGVTTDGDGNRVDNCLLHFAEGVAMVLAGTNSVLSGNDVSRSVCPFSGDADASRFFGEDNAIRGNFFHDVLAEDSPDCHPHCDCFQTYAVNPGEVAHRITIEDNVCYNICGQMFMGEGILADDTHSDITFRGNVFERVGAIAMNAGGISNLRLERNTWVRSGLGAIAFSDAPGASLSSNLFYENPYSYGCDGCTVDYDWIFPGDCHMDAFTEAHGVSGSDPILEDPANHDFRPAPGSPACAAGESGGAVGALACDPVTGCHDEDGDGFGRPTSTFCAGGGEDCDDADADVHPGLAEACDGKDNDCDRLVDEDCAAPTRPLLALSFEGTLADSSPLAFAPTWQDGQGGFVAGHVGQALSLPGGGGGAYVLVGEDPRLKGMGMLTVDVWARKRSAGGGGAIVLKHVYYSLGVSGDTVDAYVQTDAGQVGLNVYHLAAVADTAWHHYVLRYDARAGQGQLQVDDVVVSTAAGSGFVRADPCDARDLYIGKDPWGNAFDGEIDELMIYDWTP